jgi:hypothetical protein
MREVRRCARLVEGQLEGLGVIHSQDGSQAHT